MINVTCLQAENILWKLYNTFTARLCISYISDRALGCFDQNVTFERLLKLESQEPLKDKKQEIWVTEVNQEIAVSDLSHIINCGRGAVLLAQFNSFKDFEVSISSGFTHLIESWIHNVTA